MALWHVNLDSISMINLIMCIGFSVDFTAHICYAYMSSTSKRPEERVKECLYALGLPIFQGAVSTILGMVGLLLADSYIFSVFFKMVFLVVFFGAMHGLFLLPVLLSLFGPGSCTNHDKTVEINMSNIDKTLPHPYLIPHPQFTLNASHLIVNLNQNPDAQKKTYKYGDLEKDLGLGTSEENSSESSSNKSNHSQNKPVANEEITEKCCKEKWRRNSAIDYSSSQFHTNQVLDIFGTDSEREWCERKERIEENRKRFYESKAKEDSKKYQDQRHRRRYSPPEQVYYRPQNFGRSKSYHNLQHPKYIQELRFP